MSSLLGTMVKLCFSFGHVADGVEERSPFPQNPQSCSPPPILCLLGGERNQAMTQNYKTTWGDPKFILIKTRDFLYLPVLCRESLSTKMCLLLKFCGLFACDLSNFLCESKVSGNNIASLTATSPKGALRVYVAKNKSKNVKRQRHRILVSGILVKLFPCIHGEKSRWKSEDPASIEKMVKEDEVVWEAVFLNHSVKQKNSPLFWGDQEVINVCYRAGEGPSESILISQVLGLSSRECFLPSRTTRLKYSRLSVNGHPWGWADFWLNFPDPLKQPTK